MTSLADLQIAMPPLVPGKTPAETTVVVAMSGGVDSSVVAALCHAAGYNTIGMTLQLWDYTPASNGGTTDEMDPGQSASGLPGRKVANQPASGLGQPKRFGTCCALDDVYDARRVCQTLGIPHYVLNMESAFKEAVIDDFVETYLAGATPVPCVRCNQRIKFKELLDKAKGLGADVLVTGHYVVKDMHAGQPVIRRADDAGKDQTYYLWTTTPEQLDFIAFPLGHFTKPHVREMAKAMGLHVHHKKDSQDICFVPGGDYKAVVKRFAPEAEAPGDIVLADGTVVGRHTGIVGFTVGQRKGVPGGFPVPMFVLEIRPQSRTVVIGPKDALGKTAFTVKEINWLATRWEPLKAEGTPVFVKLRAQHEPVEATLLPLEDSHNPGRGRVELWQSADAIAPGQAAVFYTADGMMMGGGWIEPFYPAKTPQHVEIV